MAIPTTEFNKLLLSLAVVALDSNAKRLAIDSIISTGGGNELDFGSVNIGGGQVDSAVRAFCWQVTDYQGNATVENFRFWLSNGGFDQANTKIKYATWKLDVTSEWIQNATPGDVGATELPTSEPAQNVFQGGDGSTTSITDGDNDTIEAIVMFVAVDASESTGVYKGVDAGNEFRFSFKYDYF